MNGVLPDAVDLKIEPVKRKRNGVPLFKMVYRETFFHPPKGLKENTQATADALIGDRKDVSVKTFREKRALVFVIEATLPREEVGNAMLSEFLLWGTLGNINLKELYLSLISAQAQAARALHALPQVAPASVPRPARRPRY